MYPFLFFFVYCSTIMRWGGGGGGEPLKGEFGEVCSFCTESFMYCLDYSELKEATYKPMETY